MRQHQKQHTKLGLVLNGIVSREDLRSYRPSGQYVETAADGQGWEIAPTVVTDEPLHQWKKITTIGPATDAMLAHVMHGCFTSANRTMTNTTTSNGS